MVKNNYGPSITLTLKKLSFTDNVEECGIPYARVLIENTKNFT
jgi:hypothetical protein